MENSEEILLNSLRNSGVSIPPTIPEIRQLTPPVLYSICSQSVSLIDKNCSFPTSLPEDSMADCFRMCSDLASTFQTLGFVGDISFHKFLYPSEEDLYKLVRFLVSRLAESSAAEKAFHEKNISVEELPEHEELRLRSQGVESVNHNSGDILVGQLDEADSNFDSNSTDDGVQKSTCTNNSHMEGTASMRIVQDSACKGEGENRRASGNEETITLEVAKNIDKHHMKLSSLHVNSSEDKLLMESEAKASEVEQLEDEYELLNKAFEMVSNGEYPIDFYIQELGKQAEARRHNLVKHETHWNSLKVPLEEKKRSLEETSWLKSPNAHVNLQKKKAIEQEIEDISVEVQRRGEEISALSAELDNRPKVAPRSSFVQRVKEITKNSRKQDIDIEKILKDTRDLQLESNSIQERLNRTYAVVSETIFREARKDTVSREAYGILTRIHETFEQTAEKILFSDRIRREVAYYESKVANTASQSLNIDKLQADLVAIKKENDILEQQLEK